jgi:hypothetical protein
MGDGQCLSPLVLPLGSRGEAPGRVFFGLADMDNSKRTGAALESHYQILVWLLPTVEKFRRSHKFTVGDRIESSALDVLDALIDATYTRDRAEALRRGNLGIEKLRFLIRLAADLRMLDKRRYEQAAGALDETGRLIGGWLKAHRTAKDGTAGIGDADTA